MALIGKLDQTLSNQQNELTSRITHLQREIHNLKANHYKALLYRTIIGGVIGTVFSFVFPVGSTIIGAFIGRKLYWNKISGPYVLEINAINKQLNNINKGVTGERSVSLALSLYLSDENVLFNDLLVPSHNGKTTQIDHVLLTPARIICIETKNITGRYYPHKDGWLWYPYKGKSVSKQKIVKSPQKQSIYHADMLRKKLKQEGYTVPVLPVVVLTNENCVWNGNPDQKCPVLSLSGLVSFLSKLSYTASELDPLLLLKLRKTISDLYR